MRILVVEDEIELLEAIVEGLRLEGYAVDTCDNGTEAYELLYTVNYDLVILDLNLPKLDGFKVLEEVRKKDKEIKIIILSARNQIDDKVKGFELGANDYLEKPFDFKELVVRIDNLLRRNFIQRDRKMKYGPLEIDTGMKEALVDGRDINLTNKEYGILEYLAFNDDRVISAEEIMEHVWSEDADIYFSTSFHYHMSSLRKKIGIDNIIVTIRGQGYHLRSGDDMDV